MIDFSPLQALSEKQLEQFKSVCSQLLARTFITRTVWLPEKGTVNNPDYTFLTIHRQPVQDYLSLLDWELRQEERNGYFYVTSREEVNRCNFNKTTTVILLALRMLYDENQEKIGLDGDALCTVRELLEKVVTDYAVLSARPNMDEVRRSLTLLENHRLIQRLDGRFHRADCRFAILPTILTAVSGERLEAVATNLRREEASHEEIAEDSAD